VVIAIVTILEAAARRRQCMMIVDAAEGSVAVGHVV
jgi:hypothetical protein